MHSLKHLMRCGCSTQKMRSLALFWNQSIEGLLKKQKPFIAKAIFWEAIRCPSFSTNVVHFVNVFLGIISGQILSCICSVFPPFHVCCLLFSIADFKPIISLSVFICSEVSWAVRSHPCEAGLCVHWGDATTGGENLNGHRMKRRDEISTELSYFSLRGLLFAK